MRTMVAYEFIKNKNFKTVTIRYSILFWCEHEEKVILDPTFPEAVVCSGRVITNDYNHVKELLRKFFNDPELEIERQL